ncbi:hypothetical protein BC828DRAFT_193956 [Blastocladiella britannica]|nr:hypothetical protein BC828DRAFT_193956 [Blastocladiella britannica]
MSAMSLCAPNSPLGCFAGDWALPQLFSIMGYIELADLVLHFDLPGTSRYWASGPLGAIESLLRPLQHERNWTDTFLQHVPTYSEFTTPPPFNVTQTSADAKRTIEQNIQRMNQSAFYHLHETKSDCGHTSKDTIYDEQLLAFSGSQWASYAIDVAAFGPNGASVRVSMPPTGIGATSGFPASSGDGKCSADISTDFPRSRMIFGSVSSRSRNRRLR